MISCAQPETFQGRGKREGLGWGWGVVERQHFDKRFVKNTRNKKKRTRREIFLLNTLPLNTLPSSPVPSCETVSVTDYASISLNMPKYPWKCLNNLFWLCQCFEYASSSYMFDRLLKMPLVLNKSGFFMQGLHRVSNISNFCSIEMLEYASVLLNVPQYAWKWLNIAECL